MRMSACVHYQPQITHHEKQRRIKGRSQDKQKGVLTSSDFEYPIAIVPAIMPIPPCAGKGAEPPPLQSTMFERLVIPIINSK